MTERRGSRLLVKYKQWISICFWLVINFLLILALVKAYSRIELSPSSYELTSLFEYCSAIYPCDLDQNGEEDVVAIFSYEPYPHHANIKAFSPFSVSGLLKSTYFWDGIITPKDSLAPPGDWDEDGQVEIPLLNFDNQKLWLKLHNYKGQVKRILELPSPFKNGQYPSNFILSDLNKDQKKELIILIESSFSGAERGLAVLDLEKKELLWYFAMGCMPMTAHMVDVNKDGYQEIVVNARAPHNGVVANGTDDDHSYLFLFDHRGQLLWRQTMGGYFTRLFSRVIDFDQDGELEIVVSKSCDREVDPEPGELRVIDAQRGEIERLIKEDSAIFYSDFFLIPGKENNLHLIVGDSSGRVTLFDQNLHKLRQVKLPYPAIVKGVTRLGKEDGHNIIVQAGFTRLFIFDIKLRELFQFSLNAFRWIENVSLYPLTKKNEGAALLNADHLFLLRKKTMPFPTWVMRLVKSHFSFHLLIFIIMNILLIFLARQKRVLVRPSLTMAQDYLEGAQEIAHRLKNVMFTVQLEAEKLNLMAKQKKDTQLSEVILPSTQSILEDTEELSRLSRVLMKVLSPPVLNLKEVEVNELLERLVGRYQDFYKERIEFILDLDKEPTTALIDEEQMEEALNNIIINAIDALPLSGKITLRTTVIYSPVLKAKKGLEIEIEDNGVGIPEDKLKEIFKPYYSTKKNGLGIGLTLTKRIIEAHGGRVSVWSRTGLGTKFAIFLPLIEA